MFIFYLNKKKDVIKIYFRINKTGINNNK